MQELAGAVIGRGDEDTDSKDDSGAKVRERKRLIERFREAIRAKHYSRRTEEAYWYWVRFFIVFSGKRHPAELGAAEVNAFLSWLATERDVAAATQNQALSALLFLYKHVLGIDLPWLGITRAKRPVRVPAVLTEAEARRLLSQLQGVKWLMAACSTGRGCARSSACGCG
jgi:site-specific recombinase XerD